MSLLKGVKLLFEICFRRVKISNTTATKTTDDKGYFKIKNMKTQDCHYEILINPRVASPSPTNNPNSTEMLWGK